MDQKETPVFFDKSGRRWKITENIVIVLTALIGTFSYWFIPQVLAPRQPPQLAVSRTLAITASTTADADKPSVAQLMNDLAAKNTAVIGSGPLVRLIKVGKASGGTYATDPFTHATLQKLSDQDIRFIDGDAYALERYGAERNKRLALTFDDGPDATYTPQLLNLLSRESVPSTFFVVGSNVAKYPAIIQRLTREGHDIGNHTFSHIDFDFYGTFRDAQEINQNERLIVAASGKDTAFFRPPYAGNSDQSLRNNLRGILMAQQAGYTVALYDFDAQDWLFPTGLKPAYPTLDGNDVVVLLHDGGGNRSRTITYVQNLIRLAKSKGYSFATLSDLYPHAAGTAQTGATFVDHASFVSAQALLVWPTHLLSWLFIFSIGMLIIISLVNILLAIRQKIKMKYPIRPKRYSPGVTVILPAYNEDKVIEKSVRSLIRSRYRKIRIVIVDDGSTDNTWPVARSLEKRYKRVSVLHQTNAGKAAALNNAIAHSDSDIVICLDADTLFPSETIVQLVRHFNDETVGAVAGVVKVGNPDSLLTKWQALEYVTGISIERSAQALLGAITIVPGACGAWRRSVLTEVGGFSSSTLAEDCDLALRIQKTRRYKILQDNEAISYTEAPGSLTALTKQRFRWTFGNIQSLWKHRSMILNRHYGWLGMYVMPSSVIAIMVPILFWPLLISTTIENILSGNYQVIVLFFFLTLAVQSAIATIGIILAKERYSYIWAVLLARFTYSPIRIYILYKTVLTVLRGVDVGWNKLARTGTAYDPLGAQFELMPARSKRA